MANCVCGKGKTASGLGYLVCTDPNCQEQAKIDKSREVYKRQSEEDEVLLKRKGQHPSQRRQAAKSPHIMQVEFLLATQARESLLATHVRR